MFNQTPTSCIVEVRTSFANIGTNDIIELFIKDMKTQKFRVTQRIKGDALLETGYMFEEKD